MVSALTRLDALLPGLHDGALSLQELLAIHKIHCLHPVADDDLPSARKYMNIAEIQTVRNTGTSAGSTSWRFSESEEPRKRQLKTPVLSLPTRSSIRMEVPLTSSDIKRVFKQFDVTGEQKLTFLGIKTAFELYYDQIGTDNSRENLVDDSYIREWIKKYDIGSKGFVDLADFMEIYNESDSESLKFNSKIQQKATRAHNIPDNREVPSEDVLKR